MRKFFLLIAAGILIVGVSANIEALHEYATHWPPPFQDSFLNVKVWQWCLLGGIVLLCVFTGVVVRYIAYRLTFVRDRMMSQPMSSGVRISISRALGLLMGALLGQALTPSIEFQAKNSLGLHVDLVLHVLVVIGLAMFVFAYWDATCDLIASRAVGHQRAERLLVPMMRKFVRAIIVICGILFALAEVFGEKTLAGLVAGLGVTGLVIALAAKDSVENVFGSLTILFDMPFAIGDYVRIDKVEGNVEEINLRSTRIRTPEDTLINLPNANLIRASVENFGARRSRRQRITVRLSYLSDASGAARFCQSVQTFIDSLENVDPGKTIVQLDDPTETSLGVKLTWCIHASSVQEEADSRSRVLEEVLRLKRGQGLLLASVPAEELENKSNNPE